MALLDRAIVRLLPAVPKPVVQLISDRYIAGRRLSDACRVVKAVNAGGKMATIDVLGEAIDNEEEARAFVGDYCEVLAAIEREGLDANVSVKPTAIGLKLAYDVLRENAETLARDAARRSNFVRIEMEESSCTDATIRVYRELREAGHDNVGIVLQAYLRRTLDDLRALAPLRPNVRLVKGIYVEPAELAFRDAQEIRRSYLACLEALLEAGGYPALATHDDYLIGESLRLVGEAGLGRDDYEFQMLLGVREQRGDDLVRGGHRLRIYVPFGEQWYAYSMRRLQENPKIAGYIAADTVNRVLDLARNGRRR